MKQYNLLGEEVEAGLRKIGAIKDTDKGPHGRYVISIQCDGLPLNEDAIILIDERKLHWTPYQKRREQHTDRAGNPVWGRDASKCRLCGSYKEPVWNSRGSLFECPDCSSTDIEKVSGSRHVRTEAKTLRSRFKKNHSPKSLLKAHS